VDGIRIQSRHQHVQAEYGLLMVAEVHRQQGRYQISGMRVFDYLRKQSLDARNFFDPQRM